MSFIIRRIDAPTKYLARAKYGALYTSDPEHAEQFPSWVAAEMVKLPGEIILDVTSFLADEAAACAALQAMAPEEQP